WPAELAEILRPLGIAFDPDVAAEVVDVQTAPRHADANVAYFAAEQAWDLERLVEYHRRWSLASEERSRKRVAFATDPLWSAFTPTYSEGEPLVRAFA